MNHVSSEVAEGSPDDGGTVESCGVSMGTAAADRTTAGA